MSIYAVTGSELRDMICVAAAYLEKNKKGVDALNVFPVPDGDTGTNMSLTMQMAAKEVRGADTASVGKVGQALSMGALRGARGNSGVILSQIFRGFVSQLQGKETLDAALMAKALQAGVESAYKAVMKPKEGTVLTVVKAMAAEGQKKAASSKSVLDMLECMLQAGEEMLKKTPDMLPVLKEAGVVDAGGVGLLVIFKGFKMCLEGEEVPDTVLEAEALNPISFETESLEDIEFGYCTEFFVKTPEPGASDQDIDRLRTALGHIGDSIVVVGEGTLIKVHVHSNSPGKALQYGLRFGELSGIKVDNMREQHRSIVVEKEAAEQAAPQKPKYTKDLAVVVVAAGKGLGEIFRDLGADVIVEGGQTMNPSIEDMLNAIESAPADKVIVFPNNKNIILAAQQAAGISQKEVAVILSQSVPQGIAGLIALDPEGTLQDNEEAISQQIELVDSGLVTYAVRDSKVNGCDVHEGDILGIFNGRVTQAGKGVDQVSMDLLEEIVTEDDEIISVFFGQDVSREQAEALCEQIEARYPDCDVQVYDGGQPLYYYIFSVE